jgi:hypothetical protein
VTKIKTRDVLLCRITGTDDPDCVEATRNAIPDAQPCVPTQLKREPKKVESYCGDGICDRDEDEDDCPEDCLEAECGDGYCDEGEEETCPEDCEEGGLGWLIFVIIMVLAVGGGIAGFLIKKKMGAKEEEGEVKEEEPMPFASKKDLDSVTSYITEARKRSMDDDRIKAFLMKGGWKPEQVDYGFKKLEKPGAKKAEKPGEKPAEKAAGKPEAAKTPFANPKDQEVVVKYILDAHNKGMNSQQIADALMKSGRTREQVKFAFDIAAKSAKK